MPGPFQGDFCRAADRGIRGNAVAGGQFGGGPGSRALRALAAGSGVSSQGCGRDCRQSGLAGRKHRSIPATTGCSTKLGGDRETSGALSRPRPNSEVVRQKLRFASQDGSAPNCGPKDSGHRRRTQAIAAPGSDSTSRAKRTTIVSGSRHWGFASKYSGESETMADPAGRLNIWDYPGTTAGQPFFAFAVARRAQAGKATSGPDGVGRN